MATVTVELRNVEGTKAALGWAGGHTIVVDRPEDKAGGYFCNDLRYAAEELGVRLAAVEVSVALELEGKPLLATAATLRVTCHMNDGSDPQALVERAKTICMVANSLRRGVPVTIERAV